MTVPFVPVHLVTSSLHGKLLKKSVPQWLLDAAPERRAALKHTDAALPQAYQDATPAQRKQLHEHFTASFTAQTALDKTMAALQDIDTFAEPLLREALKDQLGVTLDVRKTWISLKKTTTLQGIELSTFEYLKLSLLEAAKHNFEASEARAREFHRTSGFLVQGATADTFTPLIVNFQVHQFLTLCRSLDIGAKYQTYIKAFFQPTDTAKAATLRRQFIASQKATMRAAAELALLQKDIDAQERAMVESVINGEVSPKLRGQPVWFCDLGIMKRRLTGCVVFMACQKYHHPKECIVYVPHDQKHSLKRFTFREMDAYFKERFTAADTPSPEAARPTRYQKFFSQFVPYSDHPYYFGQFTKDGDSSWAEKYASTVPAWSEMLNLVSLIPVPVITNLPPAQKSPQRAEDDPYLHIKPYRQKGQGPWGNNVDLWGYLFDRSCSQSITDAAAHAVPTADVDARVRAQKIASWLNIGLFAATFFASFVPVLGELMLVFMAGQLVYEAFEGAIEWAEGDRKAAKAHLIDLAENLVQIALFHAAGKGVGKLLAIKPALFVEDMQPVKLPNGQTRLWKPDLSPYKSDVTVPDDVRPNALGQYEINDKTYIRLNSDLYEKTFDSTLKKWRIKHPSDPAAYQPILEHNQAGAWRHLHERPLQWDRLTLLRRLGHRTEEFSDEVLRTIGEVSGVEDDVLRKVHVDGLPVPAALADTLEQFSLDRQVGEVIARVRRGSVADSRFECMLPLTVELPLWPVGRVLEVFEGPERWGASQRYGVTSSTTEASVSIKLTRSEVQAGKLGEKVLSQMSADEITRLLGSASGWNGLTAEQVFNERLADHALKRQPALFDSLWRSRAPKVPDTSVLGRRYPSLPRQALDEVLDAATPRERSRLDSTGKVPTRLDDLARIRLQQHRLNRAIAGLHRENLASLDSDRLALHSLERLPGWPAGLRLELRGDKVDGPLLDSIGAEDATIRKYLVKEGGSFQARDERGAALHSVSPYSRNFYQSILQALPDEFRSGLGIAGTHQDALLKQTLANYASGHRSEMASILGQRTPRSRPSLRLADGRLGYPLSGRGAGAGVGDLDRLITRVRDIYPNVSEAEAEAFVQRHLSDGEHPQQIFNVLANRQRELDDLRSALGPWVGIDRARLRVADNVIDCWRSGLNRGGARLSSLNLIDGSGLPTLNADFSHVGTLRLSGSALLMDRVLPLVRQFPNVRRLEVLVDTFNRDEVTERLASFSDITELVLTHREYSGLSSTADFPPEVMQSINRMTQLEQLSLNGSMDRLDVSGLVNLRGLEVSGSLATWPEGVLGLEHLETLNLSSTRINSIAPQMLTGHERLWRGLRMNWRIFEPQAFMEAYEHVRDNPAHLVDEEVMVRLYAEGTLSHLTNGDAAMVSRVIEEFRLQQVPGSEQIERLEAARSEQRELTQALQQWLARDPADARVRIEPSNRQRAETRILASWREGLAQRLAPGTRPGPGPSRPVFASEMRLDLSGGALADLPALPAAGFSHVRDLDLAGVRVPFTELESFLGRFTQVEHLGLAYNNLTRLPSGLTGMTSLRSLDLSRNLLQVTPTMQARLNEMTRLTSLSLQLNPVRTLDISHLSQLTTLDLRRTAIRAWPAGAVESPTLQRLDLSHSAVTSIAQAALTGHDRLLTHTNLRGCRLTTAAVAQAQTISQRLPGENPLGIPRALLNRGRTGGDPEYFPDGTEQNPNLLLPLPLTAGGDAAPITAAARLQRLDPHLDTAQAVARIDALRGDGLNALQIEARLRQWEAQQREWIQVLNGWIDIQGVRSGSGWISAIDRRRAAERLLSHWRYSLRESPPLQAPLGQHQLDLSGLTLGDLPALPSPLEHVRELNLSNVMITEQGTNEFLRAFGNIETLNLDNNGLSVLPDAVSEFRSLRHLDAIHNELRDATALRRQLLEMPMLESLNLGGNRLAELDVSGMTQLQTLNLPDNELEEWPAGVFQATRLRTLNLRNNRIETIPSRYEMYHHQALMAGTDVFDNLLLEDEFENLRTYLQNTGNGLGFTRAEIDRMIEGYHPDDSDGGDEPLGAHQRLGADAHPEIEPSHVQRDRWFTGVAEGSERYQAWEELRAAPDSADFFFTLSQLRNTLDFQRNPADVRARVWRVLDALYADPSLRTDVFARARAAQPRMTCGDGRILVFNDLETAVYEFNVRSSVTPAQEGVELFRLARGMNRLDAVESIAEEVIRARPRADAAEIRLAYRIGLAQRLELPNQPHGMIYATVANVTQAALDTAYDTIIESEAGDDFVRSLVQRTYWLDYLKRAYPAEFETLSDSLAEQTEALDARYPEGGAQYLSEYGTLGRKRADEETALAIELTVRERTRLGV
ncbi:NEL-type E3 ubiquitin ligase domain-containing protein [Pseudomonas sp. W4I3]|uniref:NEL-type E3 ubiquitin ligase domain-containing protein n=1 Tax=Pseudomonas sp. W4I3 TaxID=3042294 RepID=UPI002782C3FB|nr:NEL-type E3 ubiquitin ligase domain-containing protein [Pseudomonas sp. W4I3]MDQ0740131.1 Leucine-rich repeat (LRR) protein [Pseudomonas sp. W4I3]